jgi:hypothetical protein
MAHLTDFEFEPTGASRRETKEADLYSAELARWFHPLIPSEDYAREAAFTLALLREHVVVVRSEARRSAHR